MLDKIKTCVWIINVFDSEEAFQNDSSIGQATGVMIRDIGLVTCAHVVLISGDVLYPVITASRLGDNKTYRATIVGTHSHRDLAILTLEHKSSPTLPICHSIPKVGDEAILAGFPSHEPGMQSPRMFETKVVANRVRSGVNIIEIESHIHPGNSGGPILSRNGLVMGIAAKGMHGILGRNECISSIDLYNYFQELGAPKL